MEIKKAPTVASLDSKLRKATERRIQPKYLMRPTTMGNNFAESAIALGHVSLLPEAAEAQ